MALANVNFKLDADVKKDAYRLKSLLEIFSMMRKMSGIWKRKWQITKRERLNLRSMS